MEEPLKLNLGCGLNAPYDWINIDNSFTARLSKIRWFYKLICKILKVREIDWPYNLKIIDVRKGLPFSDNSVFAIFSSHMLEHMSYEDAKVVIKECNRVLKKDGVIRIIVPDLYQITNKYINSIRKQPKAECSHSFLKDLNIFPKEYKGVKGIVFKFLNHSKYQYMYDKWSLKNLMQELGFREIKQMNYCESRISNIKSVEKIERYISSICLEGIK